MLWRLSTSGGWSMALRSGSGSSSCNTSTSTPWRTRPGNLSTKALQPGSVFRQRLSTMSPADTSIALWTYPDSFDDVPASETIPGRTRICNCRLAACRRRPDRRLEIRSSFSGAMITGDGRVSAGPLSLRVVVTIPMFREWPGRPRQLLPECRRLRPPSRRSNVACSSTHVSSARR